MWIFEDSFILIYCCTVAAVLGAVFGSFLNCAAWRIAHKESFLKGRSHCPSCGHELGVPDLIPVFSWLFLKGRCRYCQEKVSVRYLLTELFMAAMFVLCLLRNGLTVTCFRNLVFGCCLFCLSLVDLDIMEIPDGCLIISAAAWAVAAFFIPLSIKEAALSILSGVIYGAVILIISMIMDRKAGRESMGGGDIKLIAVSGLYLGFVSSLFMLLLACILGLFGMVFRKDKKAAFPFGPFLSAAAWIMLLFGKGIADWYLGLLM